MEPVRYAPHLAYGGRCLDKPDADALGAETLDHLLVQVAGRVARQLTTRTSAATRTALLTIRAAVIAAVTPRRITFFTREGD